MNRDKFKVAAVQAAPVFLDLETTVDKACRLIHEAAENGAAFVLLPEAFIPGYPDWVWNVPAGQFALNQKLYGKLLENAVSIGDAATDKLCQAAREANIFVAVGINEKNSETGGGSLSNTLLYIDDEGNILGRHQKLIPTLSERTIWSYGDPGTLQVFDTGLGKIGGLICWENYMPLARYALYARGVSLYLAPTYDESRTWQATLRHIAKEGRTYVIGCCMAYKKEEILSRLPELEPFYKDAGEWINGGNSMIVDPNGDILAGPLHKEEGILYADVDMELLRGMKWNLDVVGHYARPDAFQLTVQSHLNPVVTYKEEQQPDATLEKAEDEDQSEDY